MGRFSNYEKQVARVDRVKLPGAGIVLKLSNIFKHLNISKKASDQIRPYCKKRKGDQMVLLVGGEEGLTESSY